MLLLFTTCSYPYKLLFLHVLSHKPFQFLCSTSSIFCNSVISHMLFLPTIRSLQINFLSFYALTDWTAFGGNLKHALISYHMPHLINFLILYALLFLSYALFTSNIVLEEIQNMSTFIPYAHTT